MIISASRRTDIPRYYAEWFIHRVRAGYCMVPNPFNPNQVSRIDLRPEAVDAFVFWTRYPKLLMPFLPGLERFDFKFYFQFTITNYPGHYEPGAAPLQQVIDCFKELAQQLGPGRVIWRYDPILFSDDCTLAFQQKNFEFLCAQLCGSTRKVVISFLDEYRKTRRRMRAAALPYQGNALQHPDLAPLLQHLAAVAQQHQMTIESCAEPEFLQSYGIARGRCIDDQLLKSEFGLNLNYVKDPGQRLLCDCMRSRDIGVNNTCAAGCLYCYATQNHAQAQKRLRNHDATAESLI